MKSLLLLLASLLSCQSQFLMRSPAFVASLHSGSLGPCSTPSTPTSFSITAIDFAQYDLSWSSGGSEQGFEIWRKLEGGAYALVTTTGTGVTTHSDTGVEATYSYYYKIRATNAPSCFSSYTSEILIPARATGMSVTSVNSSGATLGWTDNTTLETGYKVYLKYNSGDVYEAFGYSNSDTEPTAANVQTWFLSVLDTVEGTHANLSHYEFTVRAISATGESAIAGWVQIPPSVTVTDLAAAVDVDDIVLTWTSTGENGTVSVYFSVGGGAYSLVASGITEASGTYTHVQAAFDYSTQSLDYKIVTGNSGGNGPYSNIYNIIP